MAMVPPITAPQTAPVRPMPPPKPVAILGTSLLFIPNSWHTASKTDSAQL
ncbi:unnamed protein product [marine sediment metagenome]|uniref:Uncharacterized protein n=1 Tax=marine sediment metagenome TaxID=412755 RepID=X0S1R2_9ZZZZ